MAILADGRQGPVGAQGVGVDEALGLLAWGSAASPLQTKEAPSLLVSPL